MRSTADELKKENDISKENVLKILKVLEDRQIHHETMHHVDLNPEKEPLNVEAHHAKFVIDANELKPEDLVLDEEDRAMMSDLAYQPESEYADVPKVILMIPLVQTYTPGDEFTAVSTASQCGQFRAIMTYLCKELDGLMHEDDHMLACIVPDIVEPQGDTSWIWDEVVKRVRFYDAMTKKDAEDMSNKWIEIKKKYDPEGKHKVGIGLLRYIVHRSHMFLSEWR